MSKPIIEMIELHKLINYKRNPRKNEGAITEVARSIEINGFTQPILINQDNIICIGHTRKAAAKLAGLKRIPCIRKTMTEKQFKSLNISDNKLGEIADWDDDLLKELIIELESEGDLDIPGLDLQDLDAILFDDEKESKAPKSKTVDQDPEENKGPTSKMTFIFPTKTFINIDGKLDMIQQENKLDTQADALVFALKNFKGKTKVKRVRKV